MLEFQYDEFNRSVVEIVPIYSIKTCGSTLSQQ